MTNVCRTRQVDDKKIYMKRTNVHAHAAWEYLQQRENIPVILIRYTRDIDQRSVSIKSA